MKGWKKRGAIIVGGLATLGIASALVLNALNSNIALYVTPTEVAAGKAPKLAAFRIGGLVKEGSLKRENLVVHFVMTDMAHDVSVSYKGILPDLFKEGKVLWCKARWKPTAISPHQKCLPNTTKTTCLRKPNRLWIRPKKPRTLPNHDP